MFIMLLKTDLILLSASFRPALGFREGEGATKSSAGVAYCVGFAAAAGFWESRGVKGSLRAWRCVVWEKGCRSRAGWRQAGASSGKSPRGD